MSDFKSCYGCVEPKRHLGCHDTCPDYLEEKEKHDKKMELHRKSLQEIREYEYDLRRNFGRKHRFR